MMQSLLWKLGRSLVMFLGRKLGQQALLVYSRRHFDPKTDSPHRPLAASSAANLARNIYQALSPGGIVYLDQSEPLPKEGSFSTVIGIASPALETAFETYPQAKKILFLVNCHPRFRLQALQKECQDLGIPLSSLEQLDAHLYERLLAKAGVLLLLGSETIMQTYEEAGVERKRIVLVQSGVNLAQLRPARDQRPKGMLRIVFPGSHLGIRKGLFRVMELWESLPQSLHSQLELVLIGRADPYTKELQRFVSRYSNVSYLGWLDSSLPEYRKALQSAHVVLALSLEEGQVGCVLEAMACGCVPIITPYCGIEIVSGTHGWLLKNHQDIAGATKHLVTLSQNHAMMRTMSQAARTLVEERHTWDQFRDKITSFITSES